MAFKLFAEIGVDGAGFERGLKAMGDSAANSLKRYVAGAFGIYAIEQAITKTVESCTELVNASSKLGMTVEQLQVMRQAAKEGGVEFEKMVTSVNKLAAIRENILTGGKNSKEQLAALARLGVTPDMLRTMTATDLMQGPIAATVKTTNPADIANDLKIVFGRAFGDIIPVLKTDFGALEGKMRSFGMIIDSTTAREMKLFGDQMGLISGIISAQLAPWLVSLGGAIFDVWKAMAMWSEYVGTLLGSWMSGHFKGSWGEAQTASDVVEDAMNKTWADFMAHAKNPTAIPPPTISEELPEAKKKSNAEKEWTAKGDALISVGNFLGAGRGAIGSVAERHLEISTQSRDFLERIANHVEAFVLHPETIAARGGFGGHGAGGSWDDLDTGN